MKFQKEASRFNREDADTNIGSLKQTPNGLPAPPRMGNDKCGKDRKLYPWK